MVEMLSDMILDPHPHVGMVLKALVVIWLTRYVLDYAKSVMDANALEPQTRLYTPNRNMTNVAQLLKPKVWTHMDIHRPA